MWKAPLWFGAICGAIAFATQMTIAVFGRRAIPMAYPGKFVGLLVVGAMIGVFVAAFLYVSEMET